MKRCDRESDDRRLVYLRRAYPLIGLPLAVVGLLIVVGNSRHLVWNWGDNTEGWWLGFVLALFVGVVGLRLLVSRRLTFDRAERQLISAHRFLGFERSKVRPLDGIESIGWEVKDESSSEGTSTTYPVVLRGPGAFFEIWRPPCSDDARRFTREVGEFLGLEQHHWDTEVLDPSSAQAAALRGKQARQAALMRRLGLKGALRRTISPSGTRLVLQSTGGGGPFLRRWGGGAALLGVFFMLQPALGGTFNGREDAFWEPIGIGAGMVIVGSTLALGRRGITLDKEEQEVRRWWGLLRPWWSQRQDLSRYAAVGFECGLSDTTLVGHAVLKGRGEPDYILYRSTDIPEAQAVAEEVAGFLGWDLMADPPVRA